MKLNHNIMTNVDQFVNFILFQNELNRKIDVVFDFLNTPFDMFNFFIYLIIKSLTILSNTDSVIVENIDMKHIATVQDRFKYAGIDVRIDIMNEENINTNMVYIHQNGDNQNIENFSLNIISNSQRYKLHFVLKST